MQDKELYQQILGLTSPWTVSEVKLDMPSQEIRVRVEHPRGTMFCCPECKKQLSCYDHGEERQWRHLTHASSKPSSLVAFPESSARAWREVGRCPLGRTAQSIHHHVRERFAIEVLLMTQTVKGAMTILRLLWDATWTSLSGLSNVVKAERNRRYYRELASTRKHSPKDKVCLDLVQHRQQHCRSNQEGHDVDAAKACFSQLSEKQLQSIQAVAMDMSPAFVRAAKETIPLAENKIVHDRFHIMKMANEAVDKIRRQEHRQLLKRR